MPEFTVEEFESKTPKETGIVGYDPAAPRDQRYEVAEKVGNAAISSAESGLPIKSALIDIDVGTETQAPSLSSREVIPPSGVSNAPIIRPSRSVEKRGSSIVKQPPLESRHGADQGWN